MKRLLTLILAVCLSLCTAVTVSAVDAAQDTDSVIKEVELLKALNIFDADIDSQKKVTRAEFAGYMASVLNIEEYNKYDKIYFIDVRFLLYFFLLLNVSSVNRKLNGYLYKED